MQDSLITDGQIQVSSFDDEIYMGHYGRLHNQSFWKSAHNNDMQWFQVSNLHMAYSIRYYNVIVLRNFYTICGSW